MKVEPISIEKHIVPELKGMGAKDAMYLLGQLGLNVQISGRGKVISQNLLPGTTVRKGQSIKITLE